LAIPWHALTIARFIASHWNHNKYFLTKGSKYEINEIFKPKNISKTALNPSYAFSQSSTGAFYAGRNLKGIK